MGSKASRLTTAVCAATVSFALAGCAGAGKRTTAVVTGAQAYQATIRATSAAVTSSLTMQEGKGPSQTRNSSTGTYSWSRQQGTFVHVDYLDPGTMTTQGVIDGSTTYTKTTGTGAIPPTLPTTGWDESTWTNTSDPGFAGILDHDLALDAVGETPVDSSVPLLGLLRSLAPHAVYVGTQVLDGVPTTHYRATAPISNVEPGDSAESFAQVFGVTSVPFDYWVDSDRQLRMLQMKLTLRRSFSTTTSSTSTTTTSGKGHGFRVSFSGQPVQSPVTMVMTDRFSDYGVPVHITLPPASEITSHSTCSATANSTTCGTSTPVSPPATSPG